MKIKLIKWIAFIYTSVFALSSCASDSCKSLDSKTCPVLKDLQIFNKNTKIHFKHLCSDLEYYSEFSRQSYVLFEKWDTNASYKALVLATLRVGWLGINQKQGVAIDFMEIKIASLWPKALLSLALEMKNEQTGSITRGGFITNYLRGPDSQINYQLDEKGNISWYDFLEPEERTATEPRNHPTPAPSIVINELTNITDEYQLLLVIKNNSTKAEIKLQGSYIEDMVSFLNIEEPKVRVLGFFDTLNPFQEGGLWSWLSLGYKYDKCIYARKKARKEFVKTFNHL